TEAGAQVLLERLLVLGDSVVLAGHGGTEHAAGVVPSQGVLQRDPAAVQGSGNRAALVDVLGVLVPERDDLLGEVRALLGEAVQRRGPLRPVAVAQLLGSGREAVLAVLQGLDQFLRSSVVVGHARSSRRGSRVLEGTTHGPPPQTRAGQRRRRGVRSRGTCA